MVLALVIIGFLYPIMMRDKSHVSHPHMQKEILYSSDSMLIPPVNITTHINLLDQIDALNKKLQQAKENQQTTVDLFNFDGRKIQDFEGDRLYSSLNGEGLVKKYPNSKKFQPEKFTEEKLILKTPSKCQFFGVVTTINPPTVAIERLITINPELWCVVIVGDKNGHKNYVPFSSMTAETESSASANEGGSSSPSSSSDTKNYIYLSLEDQQKLIKHFSLLNHLSVNHISRKIIGYLYAMLYHPQMIYDFDDDYSILSMKKNNNIFHNNLFSLKQETSSDGGNIEGTDYLVANELLHYNHTVLNIFPLLGSNIHPSWPRGFPINYLKETDSSSLDHSIDPDNTATATPTPLTLEKREMKKQQIGIIHSVTHHFPDVDIIYKMIMPLPISFPLRGHLPVLLPSLSVSLPEAITPVYAPFNSKSTFFFPSTYWSLFLPLSINNHMIDIYRAYIVERILHELNYRNTQQVNNNAPPSTTATPSTTAIGAASAENAESNSAEENKETQKESSNNHNNNNNFYSEIRILFHAPVTVHQHKDLYNDINENNQAGSDNNNNNNDKNNAPPGNDRKEMFGKLFQFHSNMMNINNMEFLTAYSKEYSIYLIVNILIDELDEFIFCSKLSIMLRIASMSFL